MATTNKAFRVKSGLVVQGGAASFTGGEVQFAAGTTSYPPILLTSGTNLTTATAGAFEYDGTNFYLTASTGGRKTIAFTDLVPSVATSSALGTIKLGSDTENTATAASVGSTNGRTYLSQLNASDQLVVNVPWTDTVYTLPTATASALGGIELFSGVTQTVAANAVTTTASRTYGLQLNSDLQGVVNVPWSDTNTFPTTWTWTDGTTAGPTASITGTSSTISVAGVPAASGTVSGIVTTGAQTFAGVKTLTSPVIDVINATSATATTPSLYGNITTGTINIGSSVTDGTVNIAGGNSISSTRTVNINTGYSGSNAAITNIGSNAQNSALNLFLGTPGITLTGSGLISTAATSGSASTAVVLKSGNATSANSGNVTIQSGTTTTSGTAGNVIIDAGTSAGTNGTVLIGGTNASSVELGRSGQTTVIKGNLQIDGTTTTVNSSTVTVDDKNLELGSVASKTGLVATLSTGTNSVTLTTGDTTGLIVGTLLTKTAGTGAFGNSGVVYVLSISSNTTFSVGTLPDTVVNHATGGSITFSSGGATDLTADGGGLTLKGATDKTLVWVDATDAWTSNQDFNLVTGKVYEIAGTSVLSATTLGAAVVNSSLTSVGTISTGTWNATTIATNKGGTGLTSFTSGGAVYATSTSALTTGTLPVASGGTGITSFGTGVATALGNATGNTGGFVTFGGAIGAATATTASVDTNTTQVATTAYVVGQGYLKSATAASTYVAAASPALTGTPTINSVAGLVTASGSTTGTTALTLSTIYSSGTYNGGEFIVKATNSTNIEITKVLVITDGSNVYMTVYGDVFVSTDLVSIDFTYTGANVNMVVTPVAGTSGTTTVKVTGTLVAV